MQKNVTAIDTIDSQLVDATFEKKVRNQRNSHTSITVSAHIGKSNYQFKILPLDSACLQVS